MKTLKITRKDTLTTKQRDKILEDKNTINLTGELPSYKRVKQNKQKRVIRKYVSFLPKIYKILFILAIIFIIIGLLNLEDTETVDLKIVETVEAKVAPKKDNITAKTEKVTIKRNNRVYSVQVWADRINSMKEMGLSDTRIIDLLTIINMECGSYKGNCFNGNDVGPFQINKIHWEQYNQSWRLLEKKQYGELFKYQLNYANRLVESYEAKNCKPEYVKKYGVGETYNQKRWRCIAFHYNGHPKNKYAYNKLGWERRNVVKSLIYKQ